MKKIALIVCLLCLMVWKAYSVWTAISNNNCGSSGDALNSVAARSCGSGWAGNWTFVNGSIEVVTAPLGSSETVTFPSSGVLDSFTRANNTTLGSNWTQIAFGSGNGPGILSNQVYPDAADDFSIMYWNPATYSGGAGVEAYIDIPERYSNNDYDAIGVYLIKTASPLDSYAVIIEQKVDTTDEMKIIRHDDGVSTVLTAVFQELVNTDAIGIKKFGSNIQAFHRTGGVWSLKATVTDTTYVEPFNVGFYASDTNAGTSYRLDNFGGGAATSANLAIWMKGGGGEFSRAITPINAGALRFLGQASSASLTNTAGIYLAESGSSKMLVNFGPSGVIQIYNGTSYVTVSSYVVNTWYTIDVEFDDVAHPDQFRARVNEGTWTAWTSVNGGSYTNINALYIDENAIGGPPPNVWLDDIQVMPAAGTSIIPALISQRRRQ